MFIVYIMNLTSRQDYQSGKSGCRRSRLGDYDTEGGETQRADKAAPLDHQQPFPGSESSSSNNEDGAQPRFAGPSSISHLRKIPRLIVEPLLNSVFVSPSRASFYPHRLSLPPHVISTTRANIIETGRRLQTWRASLKMSR